MFSVSNGAKDRDAEVNPMLPTIARYLNTLGKCNVPATHRHLVVMFHQRDADFDIVLTNDAYKARYGKDNPNVALIHALKRPASNSARAARRSPGGTSTRRT